MKNFEVQHTIRLYDPELIAAIGQAYDDHRKEFRNKNEFLTYLLRLGLKVLNSPPPKTPASGAMPPCSAETLADEVKAVREIVTETSKYLTTQFKKLYIHIAIAEKLLSATYNMKLGDLSGTPPMPEKVEDGFFDDLPMRFEKIILTLENHYGLR